jgi:2-methylaconitate cis-trans-isomerase PrpF
MTQIRIPAVFMRGGTSKAIVFHQKDLPTERRLWDEIFLTAIGSPDPYGRQLDGMGGGVSSLSKVCVVGPSTRPDADIDYTFAQVLVKDGRVDYSSNCGNMTSAMGPFALDEGLVKAAGKEALVRIHNTNTHKIIHARFPLHKGSAAVDGELEIPGVAGTGAPVRLEFLQPGGATTGKLLPTGKAIETLEVPGLGRIEVSMVDAANACVFVRARDIGLTGIEMPEALEADSEAMRKLGAIRIAAAVAMGIARNAAEAAESLSNPAIGIVAEPQDAKMLSGAPIHADRVDLTARMLSKGQTHRALPLTRALCMAVAARIEGTLVHEAVRPVGDPDDEIRIGMPSGVLVAAACVRNRNGQWDVERGAFLRTQRRLFEGRVLMRSSRGPGLASQPDRHSFAA